mgnify:CR=1|jgi:hypothetical protein|tara:strand:+ start:1239 stop:1427 length:189 start_codon:yes stop_codon:yes gene_type:complete
MDDLDLASYLRKVIAEKRSDISNVLMEGMLKDVEHYKNLQGQLEVLKLIEMNISDFYKGNKF